ncbi:MAG: cupredoxin domain-containing protein [Actinomycetota bacterium]
MMETVMETKKWLAPATVAVFLLAAACTSSKSATAPASTGAIATTGAPSAVPQGSGVPVTVAEWSVTPPVSTLPSGKTTFTVTNSGTITHEFVVLSTDTAAADIAIKSFEGEPDRINEDTAGTNVGETGDMQPGTTKTLKINLAPGHYVFFCNLPGHYGQGMHVDFTIS